MINEIDVVQTIREMREKHWNEIKDLSREEQKKKYQNEMIEHLPHTKNGKTITQKRPKARRLDRNKTGRKPERHARG